MNIKTLVNSDVFIATAIKLAKAKLTGTGAAATSIGLGVGITYGGGKLWDAGTKKKDDEEIDDVDEPKKPKKPKKPKQASQSHPRLKATIMAMPSTNRFAKYLGIL